MQDQEIAINYIYFSDMKNTFICDEYWIEGWMSVKSMRKAWFLYLIFISLFPYVFTSSFFVSQNFYFLYYFIKWWYFPEQAPPFIGSH